MKKRPLIGIIISVLSRIHMQNILRGAIAQAKRCGCDVIVLAPLVHFIFGTQPHAAAEAEFYQLIASGGFDGFLYVKDDATMDSGVIAQIEALLLRSNQYVMTVDEKEHPVFDTTQYDDYDDFGKVIRHLIEEHGFRKIYCLTGPEEKYQAQTRLRAYQDAMNEHGLYFDETYYTYGTFWVDSAIAFAGRLHSGELSMPEAVVCGNDVMAMALIKSLCGFGIRVPEDIAVTGYDGYPFSANVDITLTTYTRNHFQLGADAVRRLCRNMTGVLSPKVSRPESGFLIGNSCGCTNVPAKQLLNANSSAVPQMWKEGVFWDDMAPDLAQADSVSDVLSCALRHTRILYQMEALRVYLYHKDGQLCPAAACGGDSKPDRQFPETPPVTSAASFLQGSTEPEVWFVSPLHLNARQFGLLTLSFGVHDRVYDESYLRFVFNLELALDRVSDTTRSGETEADSASKRHRAFLHQTLESLRSTLQESPELPWTMEMLCMETNLPKSTLQKYYKQFFGKSAFEELIAFRVALAKRLLTETDLSLSEITVRCGYSTESYFMKQFKQLTGTTPTLYRKNMP